MAGLYFLASFLAFNLLASSSLKADAAVDYQFGFQDPATPIAEGIIAFHHDLMILLVFVVVFVSWVLARTVYHFHHTSNFLPNHVVHGTTIEIVWTIVPALILMVIAVPSFALL